MSLIKSEHQMGLLNLLLLIMRFGFNHLNFNRICQVLTASANEKNPWKKGLWSTEIDVSPKN